MNPQNAVANETMLRIIRETSFMPVPPGTVTGWLAGNWLKIKFAIAIVKTAPMKQRITPARRAHVFDKLPGRPKMLSTIPPIKPVAIPIAISNAEMAMSKFTIPSARFSNPTMIWFGSELCANAGNDVTCANSTANKIAVRYNKAR